MTKEQLVLELSKAILLQDRGGRIQNFSSFLCVRSYFDELAIDELEGIATQYQIEI